MFESPHIADSQSPTDTSESEPENDEPWELVFLKMHLECRLYIEKQYFWYSLQGAGHGKGP